MWIVQDFLYGVLRTLATVAVSNYHGKKVRRKLFDPIRLSSFQKVKAETKIATLKKCDFQTEKMKVC